MTKLFDAEGNEVEALLPDEVNVKITEATKAKEEELNPQIKGLKEELDGAKKSLGERANQFAQFRRLTDEQAAKLSDAERTIYENGLALAKANEDRATVEKRAAEVLVESSIRSKVGSDDKLFTKVKDMWGVVGIEAITPEQIESKTKMILGAIGATEPDLLATVAGFSNGSFAPPPSPDDKKGDESFGNSDRGKAIANDLGLQLEPKK